MSLELKDVTKVYKNDVVAVENMNMVFEEGKFYVIMGPSGSGKSTLLNMIGTIETITKGNIYWNGQDYSQMKEKDKEQLRKEHIGFLFQGFYLNPYLNAVENVEVPLFLREEVKKKERRKRAEQLLEQFGLKERKKHFPEEMSGGEQQRVCMARALANNPDIILADEPTGNLDSENEINVLEHLKQLTKQGKLVIVVTHNELVKQYADEVVEMKKGKVQEKKL